ncbi:polyprenyl synthetase family protein [Sinomonas humi]|uniref:Dimethylallyltranstransferase n=1 Tax=Sinomonas humi TaxID=1338436 RepID=A0A0B2ACL2_9MICC|nr:polyprenyl synthetase family protein [Sinomonas humi]KHL00966.1 dimethylallyltranstransferase [Sinomonas humi]
MTATVSILAEGQRRIDAPLRSALDRLDPATRHVCGYHLGFWDSDASPISGTGKGIRPALALLSAWAAGAGDEIGIPAAVACELIHNFSLLHDDVMDHDTERRHRTTAWAQFGVPAAILAGDALCSLASEVLAEAPSATKDWAVRCLTASTRRLIAGQAADLAFETQDQVSLAECLKMAADKTGALMACSASLGAVLADAPAELALGLAEFGEHLGLAFQLADDILGIWGNPERTGKPVLSDLRSRKKSVPVVYALASGTPAGDRLAVLYAQPDELNEAQLHEAAELVSEAGGKDWTEQRADEELEAALARIDSLLLPGPIAEDFTTLARQLSHRDR